jgi:hypothetical protein
MQMTWGRDIPNWSRTQTVFENNMGISWLKSKILGFFAQKLKPGILFSLAIYLQKN